MNGCKEGQRRRRVHAGTVAVAVFGSRVAPVLDSCGQVLLIRTQKPGGATRGKLHLKDLTSSERVLALKRACVSTLICGGISEGLHTMLDKADISVIDGIAGEIEDVLSAFFSNQLYQSEFYMPGRSRD